MNMFLIQKCNPETIVESCFALLSCTTLNTPVCPVMDSEGDI